MTCSRRTGACSPRRCGADRGDRLGPGRGPATTGAAGPAGPGGGGHGGGHGRVARGRGARSGVGGRTRGRCRVRRRITCAAAWVPGHAAHLRPAPGRRGGHGVRPELVRAPAAARDDAAQLRGRLLVAELPAQRAALRDRGELGGHAVRRAQLRRRPRGHRPAAAGHRNGIGGRGNPTVHVHVPGHPALGQPAGHHGRPRLPAARAAGDGVRQRHSGAAHRLGRGVLPGGRAA